MSDFFLADPHLGHDFVRKAMRPQFESIEQMHRVFVEAWNGAVGPKDTVKLLGDVFLKMSQREALRLRSKLNGDIHLITGNHDQIAKSIPQAWGFVKESYLYTTKTPQKIAIYLHHFAHRVWPKSHKGSWHLYGHSHGKLADDPRLLSFDVGVDAVGFTPLSLDKVIERMNVKIAARNVVDPRNAEYDELEQLARLMPKGPYFSVGWTVGDRGFEVGAQNGGRPRIASDMNARVAQYYSLLTPELVLSLVTKARGVRPEVQR